MKVGIITQPLLNNYGGILQNFALQRVLDDLGYESVTFDCQCKITPWWMYLCSWLKTFIFLFVPGKRRSFAKRRKREKRSNFFEDFVSKNIALTIPIKSFSCCSDLIDDCDFFIVGSDQVWRPKYAPDIGASFLSFLKNKDVRRISYAASFGVDCWEFSPRQTSLCAVLAKKFDAISVREESGVRLCHDYLGVEATCVLDPTLLLTKQVYCDVCKNVPVKENKILVCYVLNESDEISSVCDKVAMEQGLEIKKFSADAQVNLSIPEWLAMFRDASYIVTDSFHGTVFSIIFGKEFKCIYNENRGAARFESLLKLYNLGMLEEKRQFSLNWLKKALES